MAWTPKIQRLSQVAKVAKTTKIKTTIAKNTFTSCQGGKGPVQRQRAREGLCQSRGEKKMSREWDKWSKRF